MGRYGPLTRKKDCPDRKVPTVRPECISGYSMPGRNGGIVTVVNDLTHLSLFSGTCGMFFDPPYNPKTCNRDPKIYTEESANAADEVREWCRARGDRKTYRIVLAGYYDEHKSLEDDGWTVHRWSAHGGFANRGKGDSRGKVNRHKEALFFSPHCHSSGLKRFEKVPV